jgi:hypothetical protein
MCKVLPYLNGKFFLSLVIQYAIFTRPVNQPEKWRGISAECLRIRSCGCQRDGAAGSLIVHATIKTKLYEQSASRHYGWGHRWLLSFVKKNPFN